MGAVALRAGGAAVRCGDVRDGSDWGRVVAARITTADWIANVLDSEDMAIRKRTQMALTSVGYCYRCIDQDTSTGCMPESDYARTLRERSGSFTTNAEGPTLAPPTIGRTR